MNAKLISTLTLSVLLIGCSETDQSQQQESTGVAAESSTDVAPQASVDTIAAETETKSLGNWQVSESRDPMTDELSKYYILDSNESPQHYLKLACSIGKDLYIYLSFPGVRDGVSSYFQKGSIRVDTGPVIEEKMSVVWGTEKSSIVSVTADNQRSFYEKVKEGSLLAIAFEDEYQTLTKNTYNITGIENAVADMEATVCRFGE